MVPGLAFAFVLGSEYVCSMGTIGLPAVCVCGPFE